MDNQQAHPLQGAGGQLFNYFTDIKNQIIEIATQKGMSATGKTLYSLEIVQTDLGFELQANASIYFMEHGRGPTSPGAPAGNPDLVEIIGDWLNARGLNINPNAVANAIHKNGTRLYRAGGNSGVLSIPLNLDRLNHVFDQIASEWMDYAKAEIGGAAP